MMGEKTAWRETLEGSRQDMGTDRLWGDRQEGRLMAWSLAQDGPWSRDCCSLWIQVEVG